jgi:hypothetical protein
MKIQQTSTLQPNSQNKLNVKKHPQQKHFTGGENLASFLRFLSVNQAWGANAVDLSSMVIPRTAVDFTRGPDAGIETARREASSTVNHSLIGAYGFAAAWALSRALNKKYDMQANKMLVSGEMLDILGQMRIKHGDILTSDENLKNYLNGIFEKVKGFNPNFQDGKLKDSKGWVSIDKSTKTDIIKTFIKELKSDSIKIEKNTKNYLKSIIIDATGASGEFKIEKEIEGKLQQSVSSLDDFIDNVYKTSKIFMNKEVAKTFTTEHIGTNVFIQAMKKLDKRTSIFGLAIAGLVGISVQPLNIYLTKLKTGKDGFVGVEGREADKSNGFKILKGAVALLASIGILSSISKKPSEIFKKVQFKGLIPTLNQFKLIYGMTLASRIFAARDKNELRETSIKDSLGFLNWFILGSFVSKLVAAGLEKTDKFKNAGVKFIKYNEAENGKGWFNWLTKSSFVTYDEILHSELKKAGVETVKGGVAKTFREMLKKAPKAVKSKIRAIGLIQVAGYLYSGLVLGLGIPKLNIAITNALEKKNKTVTIQKQETAAQV